MIAWKPRQRSRVVNILNRHPPASARCAEAARAILPTAQEVDGSAHALVIRAEEGALYVQPKGLAFRWFHHVTVSAVEHCVDALTGPDGHEQQTYLERFFDAPEQHVMRPVKPDEWGEL